MESQEKRALLSVVARLPDTFFAVLAAGPGAALEGVLRAGDSASPVEPPPCQDL